MKNLSKLLFIGFILFAEVISAQNRKDIKPIKYEVSASTPPKVIEDSGKDKQTGYRASLYNSPFPFERGNLNGSAAVINAGLPREAKSSEVAVDVIELPFPTLLATRSEDEVFVIGGMPFFLNKYISKIDGKKGGFLQTEVPYIAKINPASGKKTVLELKRKNGINYLGGMLVHANGYVYAVARNHLYKINPDNMSIEISTNLPKSKLISFSKYRTKVQFQKISSKS